MPPPFLRGMSLAFSVACLDYRSFNGFGDRLPNSLRPYQFLSGENSLINFKNKNLGTIASKTSPGKKGLTHYYFN